MRLTRNRCASIKCIIASLLAVAILALSTPAVYAAGGVYGSLAGTVVDSSTRSAISGATVSVKSPSNSYNATTDSGGHFTILGVAVDTYTVTVTAAGHDIVNIPGVTVFGDQANAIGTVALEQHLATIARVTSRSVSSAYQPTQTTDTYTINKQQMLQSTGNPNSTDENAALLSVPGVTLTNNSGSMFPGSTQVTIRGASATEIGYQFDGVPLREPFFHQNGTFGLMNGVGSVQVVEGPADATQAGVGAGVINVIPTRGTGPGSGNVSLTVGSPNFMHQLNANYGFSTPDNRFSEYISYVGDRSNPYFGYHNTNLTNYGDYFAGQYLATDQLMNNFFYKFGKDLTQQFQVLYMNTSTRNYAGVTGCGGINTLANSCALAYYPYDQTILNAPANGYLPTIQAVGGPGFSAVPGFNSAAYAGLIGLTPGVPATNVAINNPQELSSNQTRFLKIEYDNSLSSSTYLAFRYYNWATLESGDGSYSGGGAWLSQPTPDISSQYYSAIGGPTSGVNLDIVHQFASNLTVTLNGQYNIVRPVWNGYIVNLEPFIGLGTFNSGLGPVETAGDWFPGGYVYNYFCGAACGGAGTPASISVPSADCAGAGAPTLPAGAAANCLPRMPAFGINFQGSEFQEYGIGLRFQYNPTDRLRFDVGAREEGQNQHWYDQLNTLGLGVPATGTYMNGGGTCKEPNAIGSTIAVGGPFDLCPSQWTSSLLNPTELEPRASVSYEMGPNDALRASYGRSAVFPDAQTAGTPMNLYNIAPYMNIPVQAGATCGNPNFITFKCGNYVQEMYWDNDAGFDGPDVVPSQPAIYTNYDISYSHLFPSGWGVRLTPFTKEGVNLPVGYFLNAALGIFAVVNKGFNKTTGTELDITTPQRAVGFSGFVAATYQNVLSAVPPFTTAENLIPLVNTPSLALGDLYRAGYVSPFDLRIGGIYNFKNGFSISPQLEMNAGYPYSEANLIAAQLSSSSCAKPPCYSNIPQVDFGPGTTGGSASLVGSTPGAAGATNYYDPANPGSALNPNIAATRGTPGGNIGGAILSHWNLDADATFQYRWSRNTIGLQLFNLFGNAYGGTVPAVNPYYQPVATGLSGPQTGYQACVNQTGVGNRGCTAAVPHDTFAFTNGAYLLTNGNFTAATPSLGPQNPFALQLYYSRSF